MDKEHKTEKEFNSTLRQEYIELAEKFFYLCREIEKFECGIGIDDYIGDNYELFIMQRNAMEIYLLSLESRAKRYNIELPAYYY